MKIPASTYRIQFTPEFTFKDLEQKIPYLSSLGVEAIYASPILKPREDSQHGYDVVDFLLINPQLGTEKDLIKLIARVHEAGMLWIQDIVPNHMAYDLDNPYIYDVLKNGRKSRYAHLFDVYWDHHDKQLSEKIMVPFLGNDLFELIENEEIKLTFTNGDFHLSYYENHYPVSSDSHTFIFQEAAKRGINADENSLDKLKDAIADTGKPTADEHTIKLAHKVCRMFNHEESILIELADMQNYRLSYWKETEKVINYRRFFTVNDLICMRVEDDEVFRETHQLISNYVQQGLFDGVRIDHIDGLLKPNKYLHDLRKLLGEDAYIIVEKILAREEKLPENWPIQGTTGYEFLAYLNELLINGANKETFDGIYSEFINEEVDIREMVKRKKHFVLHKRMAGELENLIQLLSKSEIETSGKLNYKGAVSKLLTNLPYYRTYLEENKDGSQNGLHSLLKNDHTYENEMEELAKVFQTKNENDLLFALRFQQLSGPLAAKGVEDTSFYLYNRLISQNEVGDDPDIFGIDPEKFHDFISYRAKKWPYTMNATSSHDTKRGEDARARIAAISYYPEEWKSFLSGIKKEVEPKNVSPNDQYMILQSLVGAWPTNNVVLKELEQRMHQYIEKALREGKNRSSWSEPNIRYEKACLKYCSSIMFNESSRKLISNFILKIYKQAIYNSIISGILKITLPGVPDIYQGSESWNFSLVDPDNRRPVDYEHLNIYNKEIDSITDKKGYLEYLWEKPSTGNIKFFFNKVLLNQRKNHPELFLHGEYQPLHLEDGSLAYLRKNNDQYFAVIVNLYHDDHIGFIRPILPEGLPENWLNILTDEIITVNDTNINFPFVCLKSQ